MRGLGCSYQGRTRPGTAAAVIVLTPTRTSYGQPSFAVIHTRHRQTGAGKGELHRAPRRLDIIEIGELFGAFVMVTSAAWRLWYRRISIPTRRRFAAWRRRKVFRSRCATPRSRRYVELIDLDCTATSRRNISASSCEVCSSCCRRSRKRRCRSRFNSCLRFGVAIRAMPRTLVTRFYAR
jgi:hypothetical protein